jgi:hypothetical protein
MRPVSYILVIAVAAGLGLGMQSSREAPACHGTLDGRMLTTAIEFADGFALEGPWRVVQSRNGDLGNGTSGHSVQAVLDRIVEVDVRKGERSATAFPEPVRMTFQGRSEEEMVNRAARVWCASVLRAHGEPTRPPAGRGSQSPPLVRAAR